MRQNGIDLVAAASRTHLVACTAPGCLWRAASATREGSVVLTEQHAKSSGHPAAGIAAVRRPQ
jgi:hypothetical protein